MFPALYETGEYRTFLLLLLFLGPIFPAFPQKGPMFPILYEQRKRVLCSPMEPGEHRTWGTSDPIYRSKERSYVPQSAGLTCLADSVYFNPYVPWVLYSPVCSVTGEQRVLCSPVCSKTGEHRTPFSKHKELGHIEENGSYNPLAQYSVGNIGPEGWVLVIQTSPYSGD